MIRYIGIEIRNPSKSKQVLIQVTVLYICPWRFPGNGALPKGCSRSSPPERRNRAEEPEGTSFRTVNPSLPRLPSPRTEFSN